MKAVVLDLDTLSATDLDMQRLYGQLSDWALYPHTDPSEVAERIRDVDIIFTNKVAITAELMDSSKRLKLIAVMATGTDVIDVLAAKQRGICVCNAVGYSTASVAQHTISLILALNTKLIDYSRAVERGDWQANHCFCLLDYPVQELAGKTLGLIGYGTLAKKVAQIAQALEMNIIAAESFVTNGAVEDVRRLAVDKLLAQSDVVSLHCPLSDKTRNLLNVDRLAMMKPSAFLINTARGGIVDETALAEMLKTGRLAGAAVDVLAEEPPAKDSVLLAADIPNLILTPHSAWGSREARQRLVDQLADVVKAFVMGRPIQQV